MRGTVVERLRHRILGREVLGPVRILVIGVLEVRVLRIRVRGRVGRRDLAGRSLMTGRRAPGRG